MGSPYLLGIVLSFAKTINVFNWTPKRVFQLIAISIKHNWIFMWCYFIFSWVFTLWYSIEPYSIEPINLSFNWMQILLSQIFLTIPCNCAAWTACTLYCLCPVPTLISFVFTKTFSQYNSPHYNTTSYQILFHLWSNQSNKLITMFPDNQISTDEICNKGCQKYS